MIDKFSVHDKSTFYKTLCASLKIFYFEFIDCTASRPSIRPFNKLSLPSLIHNLPHFPLINFAYCKDYDKPSTQLLVVSACIKTCHRPT